MKPLPALLCLSCTALLFTACEYDDDDGYRSRSVSVSTGGAYYGDGYDEYSPYYSYSGRRYYRTGNRYVYYTSNRPSYVQVLPSGATYITPRRNSSRSGTAVRTYRQEPTVNRYETTSERRSYDTRNGRSEYRERDGYPSSQARVESYSTREVRHEPAPPQEVRRVISGSRVRVQADD